jgi:hypothetical protein
MEMEELHLEPGLDPIYLHAACFVDLPRSVAEKAFEIIGRHRGGSPLFLVSDDGALEERLGGVQDSSDLHAALKQVLGPRCMSYARPQEPEMEQVS